MRLKEAKKQTLNLINKNIEEHNINVSIDSDSPDRDVGKFVLEGKPARVIAPFDGFFANISLDWFQGADALPKIQRSEFYWYVFALGSAGGNNISDYFICNYKRMKKWVLDFEPISSNDHRDHHDWRGEIKILGANQGYFRWGDESPELRKNNRFIKLNNIDEIVSSYVPSEQDIELAVSQIASIGEEVSIEKVLMILEQNAKESGYILPHNWLQLTKKYVLEKWSE